MKVLIAIDSFKGSISSRKGSEAIAAGIKDVYPESEILLMPLADGGEGTVETLVQVTNGTLIVKEVLGPYRNKVQATYGTLDDGKTAVIEVAEACGLPLVPNDRRNPLFTTTYGVGELIKDAMDRGCREFVIGLGGSATNDAGMGMLQALGYRFLNEKEKETGLGGKELKEVYRIDSSNADSRLKECSFKVACDVDNPLYGSEGASHVFGPQKGATSEMIQQLDEGLKQFSSAAYKVLGENINDIPGAGAAGGLGAAFGGFLNGELQSGIDLVLEIIEMEKQIQGADFVITGEGKLDAQTSRGKAPLGVARLGKRYNIPVIALAGSVTEKTGILNGNGITSYFSIVNTPMSLEEAMNTEVAYNNLKLTANQLFRLIKAVNNVI
ncbi:glycerate kinase [Terribacillus goriensis]|uniref:glycerate kinase n=1 Tax=Terribacillus saccharophilus TaxID=361277 RepID=UPI0039833A76